MIFHRATEAKKGTGGFRPTLLTDHHDEETERLTGLGASLVSEEYQPPGSPSSCQAPVPDQARTDDLGPATAGPKSSNPPEDGYEPPMLRLPSLRHLLPRPLPAGGVRARGQPRSNQGTKRTHKTPLGGRCP